MKIIVIANLDCIVGCITEKLYARLVIKHSKLENSTVICRFSLVTTVTIVKAANGIYPAVDPTPLTVMVIRKDDRQMWVFNHAYEVQTVLV